MIDAEELVQEVIARCENVLSTLDGPHERQEWIQRGESDEICEDVLEDHGLEYRWGQGHTSTEEPPAAEHLEEGVALTKNIFEIAVAEGVAPYLAASAPETDDHLVASVSEMDEVIAKIAKLTRWYSHTMSLSFTLEKLVKRRLSKLHY